MIFMVKVLEIYSIFFFSPSDAINCLESAVEIYTDMVSTFTSFFYKKLQVSEVTKSYQ